jgi:hypothetical protein
MKQRSIAGSVLASTLVITIAGCGATPQEFDETGLGEQSASLCTVTESRETSPWPWPGNVVPYTFTPSPGFVALDNADADDDPNDDDDDANEQTIVTNAMAAWTTATGGNVFFRPKTSQDAVFLTIDKLSGAEVHSGAVGPNGVPDIGGGAVNSGNRHLQFSGISPQTAVHELGHVLNLAHHQQRADRDDYLTMFAGSLFGSVNTGPCNGSGTGYNGTFTRVPGSETYGSFDFSSRMLYTSTGASGASPGYLKKSGGNVNGWEFADGSASYRDGSAVIEASFKQFGWAKAAQLDATAKADLNPARTFGTSAVYAVGSGGICYKKDATPLLIRVVRGTDFRVWGRTGNGSTWSPLSSATYASDPACASWGADRVDVVALGNDNNIYKTGYHGGAWEVGPSSIGKPEASVAPSAPSIAAWGTDRLDIFAFSSGSLYWKNWNGSAWSSWAIPRSTPSGVSFTGRPGVASEASGKLAVAARGNNGKLYLLQYASGAWSSSWSEIGSASGSGVGSPAVASWGSGRLDFFVRGATNDFIWQKTLLNGSWIEWIPLGGALADAPTAAATTGKIDIMTLTQDTITGGLLNGLWEKTWRQ